MLTYTDLKTLPKALLIELKRTAGVVGYDLHMAREKVREELEPEWAHVCDPTLLEREAELTAQLDHNREWTLRLHRALEERRSAFARVAAGDVLGND